MKQGGIEVKRRTEIPRLRVASSRLLAWNTIALQVGYLDSFVDLAHIIREDLIQADGT